MRTSGNKRLLFGAVGLLVFAVFMVAIFEKQAIMTAVEPGSTIKAEFPRDYKLDVHTSVVKMAGTPVGVVNGVDRTERGTEIVSLKLDDGVTDKLGAAPTAEIRPTTMLGGKYYISLTSGGPEGDFGEGTIPLGRTRTPVELDKVLQALPGDARKGLQGTTAQLDATLVQGGKESLRGLVHNAPGTLAPAGAVFDAMRGSHPGDLSSLVSDVDNVAAVLTRRDGQLGEVVDSLASTTDVLARQSVPLADTVHELPSVLRTSRTGLRDLGNTLDRVPGTAEAARPGIQELSPVLQRLDPVLRDARPVLDELHPVMQQARPLVGDLVPTTQQGTSVLNDVRGPALDRINGPIIGSLNSEWRGVGPKYPHGGDGAKFYEEIAYFLTNISNGTKVIGNNGYFINFALGAGPNSVMDAPAGLDRLTDSLSTMMGPPHKPGQPYDLSPVLNTLRGLAPQQLGPPDRMPGESTGPQPTPPGESVLPQQHGTRERPPS